MQTWVALAFADGEYDFRLGLAQINEIETKCGPLGEVFARLLRGRYIIGGGEETGAPNEAAWKVSDLVEVIRQGLIGGGKARIDGEEVAITSHRVNELIRNYVLDRPLSESWTLAAAILSALIQGYEPPKKAEPPKAAAKTSRKASSEPTDTPELSPTAS